MIVFKIHVKILSMYLKYYFKYMYYKNTPQLFSEKTVQ